MIGMRNRTLPAIAALAVATLAAGCGSGGDSGGGSGGSSAKSTRPASSSGLDPANFTTKVDNPWFPLKPGTTWVYKGTDDEGKPTRDVVHVTRSTKVVGGVRVVVASDRVYTEGRLAERTHDYYAQDKQGNVWYVGEDTADLGPGGKVITREGTWHAGVDGAKAGLFMPARPRVGERHRQEYYKGHAEDEFQVLKLGVSISTPFRSFNDALLTQEVTRLEPGIVGVKYYARGIGQVAEQTTKGNQENLKLVALRRG
jgi:hypothetical protein